MPASPEPGPTARPERARSVDELRIVDVRELELEPVLQLLDASLGPAAVERSADFYRWKHERNPFGRSYGLGALDRDGRLVALRLFMRWRFAAGDATVDAVRAVDTATHPSWQRRGLFRLLTLELANRLAAEGIAFVFNTPNEKSRPGYLAMGWRDVGRLPLLVHPRWLRLVASRRGPVGGREVDGLVALAGIEELIEEPQLPAFLARWERDEPRLRTPRDAAYLRWRYAEAPGIRYRCAWQLEGESGAVAVVRQRSRSGRRETSLSELLVSDDPTGIRIGASLARRIGKLGGDYVVAIASRGTPERRALRRAGFLPARRLGPRLVMRPLATTTGGGDREASGRWRLSVGDAELF